MCNAPRPTSEGGKNLRSTKSICPPELTMGDDTDIITQEAKTNLVYLTIVSINWFNGTGYSDLTGQFPPTFARGNHYLFIYYSYDANAILWEARKNRSDMEMI